ncbi:hypothetical protein HELRODRAFT_147978, partial [Helobdella robusta]|uniref:Uncharacterized protein n=1 Tax=Helobdella robusta TaxID=6412 RepID=T1EK36_HELRO
GARGTAYKWFASYLNDRHQYVQISNSRSLPSPIITGAPQGSILGPLLLNIFI